MRIFKLRRRVIAVSAATVLFVSIGAVAYSATVPNPDPCDSRYASSYTGLRNYVDCRLDRIEKAIPETTVTVPGPTVTVTAPASSATSPTTTATTSTTSSTTTATTSTTSSTTTATTSTTSSTTSPAACVQKPDATNVGATGTLPANGTTVLNTPGQVFENVTVSNLSVQASNVTVRNVKIVDYVDVIGADDVTLDRVTTKGVYDSSSLRTTLKDSKISGGGQYDALGITSDGGRYITGTKVLGNYFGPPSFPDQGQHWDATQVRGAANIEFRCNNYTPGPWQNPFNANIYLEDAQGGEDNVIVANNWLYDNASTIMLDPGSNYSFTDNHFGGSPHWRYCSFGHSSTIEPGFTSTGNIDDNNGQAVNLPAACQ